MGIRRMWWREVDNFDAQLWWVNAVSILVCRMVTMWSRLSFSGQYHGTCAPTQNPVQIHRRVLVLQIRKTCPGEWMDFNGHMRDAFYVLLISFANDQLMDELGMGPEYLKTTGCTLYNLDNRIQYRKEAREGDPLRVDMRLLDAGKKRLHLHSTIYHDVSNAVLAVNEAALVHVKQPGGPKAIEFPAAVMALVAERLQRDNAAPKPNDRVGGIGITG